MLTLLMWPLLGLGATLGLAGIFYAAKQLQSSEEKPEEGEPDEDAPVKFEGSEDDEEVFRESHGFDSELVEAPTGPNSASQSFGQSGPHSPPGGEVRPGKPILKKLGTTELAPLKWGTWRQLTIPSLATAFLKGILPQSSPRKSGVRAASQGGAGKGLGAGGGKAAALTRQSGLPVKSVGGKGGTASGPESSGWMGKIDRDEAGVLIEEGGLQSEEAARKSKIVSEPYGLGRSGDVKTGGADIRIEGGVLRPSTAGGKGITASEPYGPEGTGAAEVAEAKAEDAAKKAAGAANADPEQTSDAKVDGDGAGGADGKADGLQASDEKGVLEGLVENFTEWAFRPAAIDKTQTGPSPDGAAAAGGTLTVGNQEGKTASKDGDAMGLAQSFVGFHEPIRPQNTVAKAGSRKLKVGHRRPRPLTEEALQNVRAEREERRRKASAARPSAPETKRTLTVAQAHKAGGSPPKASPASDSRQEPAASSSARTISVSSHSTTEGAIAPAQKSDKRSSSDKANQTQHKAPTLPARVAGPEVLARAQAGLPGGTVVMGTSPPNETGLPREPALQQGSAREFEGAGPRGSGGGSSKEGLVRVAGALTGPLDETVVRGVSPPNNKGTGGAGIGSGGTGGGDVNGGRAGNGPGGKLASARFDFLPSQATTGGGDGPAGAEILVTASGDGNGGRKGGGKKGGEGGARLGKGPNAAGAEGLNGANYDDDVALRENAERPERPLPTETPTAKAGKGKTAALAKSAIDKAAAPPAPQVIKAKPPGKAPPPKSKAPPKAAETKRKFVYDADFYRSQVIDILQRKEAGLIETLLDAMPQTCASHSKSKDASLLLLGFFPRKVKEALVLWVLVLDAFTSIDHHKDQSNGHLSCFKILELTAQWIEMLISHQLQGREKLTKKNCQDKDISPELEGVLARPLFREDESDDECEKEVCDKEVREKFANALRKSLADAGRESVPQKLAVFIEQKHRTAELVEITQKYSATQDLLNFESSLLTFDLPAELTEFNPALSIADAFFRLLAAVGEDILKLYILVKIWGPISNNKISANEPRKLEQYQVAVGSNDVVFPFESQYLFKFRLIARALFEFTLDPLFLVQVQPTFVNQAKPQVNVNSALQTLRTQLAARLRDLQKKIQEREQNAQAEKATKGKAYAATEGGSGQLLYETAVQPFLFLGVYDSVEAVRKGRAMNWLVARNKYPLKPMFDIMSPFFLLRKKCQEWLGETGPSEDASQKDGAHKMVPLHFLISAVVSHMREKSAEWWEERESLFQSQFEDSICKNNEHERKDSETEDPTPNAGKQKAPGKKLSCQELQIGMALNWEALPPDPRPGKGQILNFGLKIGTSNWDWTAGNETEQSAQHETWRALAEKAAGLEIFLNPTLKTEDSWKIFVEPLLGPLFKLQAPVFDESLNLTSVTAPADPKDEQGFVNIYSNVRRWSGNLLSLLPRIEDYISSSHPRAIARLPEAAAAPPRHFARTESEGKQPPAERRKAQKTQAPGPLRSLASRFGPTKKASDD